MCKNTKAQFNLSSSILWMMFTLVYIDICMYATTHFQLFRPIACRHYACSTTYHAYYT